MYCGEQSKEGGSKERGFVHHPNPQIKIPEYLMTICVSGAILTTHGRTLQ